jgi:hypothetical protein
VTAVPAHIREAADVTAADVLDSVAHSREPVVLRGLVSDWPLVRESGRAPGELDRYLAGFYEGAPVTAFVSEPATGGRIFYTDGLDRTNFEQIKTTLDWVLSEIGQNSDPAMARTIYMGSMAMDYCLPGLSKENSLPLGDLKATVRIWIGNRSKVAAHYDVLENIACVCAGRRRFTLFPPDQLPNLYVGPIDFTPAGQPVSMVDLGDPDLDRFPRFAEALAHAQTAELAPGDAIYIPSMWWHHVEGLDPLNILVNHWWRETPAYLGAPGDALLHAILCIRDLPPAQREAWQGIFEHYVFDAGSETSEHIPEGRRGVLGPLDEEGARKLRAVLRNKLAR